MRSSFLVAMLAVYACDSLTAEERSASTFTHKAANQPARETRQERAARAMGLTDYKFEGTALIGCAKGDSALASEHFTARNVLGDKVSGTVCCGLVFKGCTVRFE